MSREIKSRAVIDDNQVMEVLSLNSDGSVIVRFGLESGFIPSHRVKSLLQYTGLKDKNGTEIYEGDILALDNESERGCYHIYKIEYSDDKARFVGVDGDEISCMPSIVNHHDGAGRYMVIGNIYENPDLLG